MCTPSGLECYEAIKVEDHKCLPQCMGLYATVEEKIEFKNMLKLEDLELVDEKYEEYRRGFQEKNDDYYRDLKGLYCFGSVVRDS